MKAQNEAAAALERSPFQTVEGTFSGMTGGTLKDFDPNVNMTEFERRRSIVA